MAVASAMPSMMPMDSTLAPSVVARKTGSRLWTSSDDTSMHRLTNPSAHTVLGMVGKAVLGAVTGLSICVLNTD
jgi:hypothetical protein